MEKYIEAFGRIVERQTPDHPERARALLAAAYSWVRFSGRHARRAGVREAAGYLNGAVAGTIADSFRHPGQAVMVNIFMPCELLHAMGIQPMFPEGLSAYLACTGCQRVFGEAAEAADVPETFCSYHKTMLGAAETGVMPRPLLIANTTLACDANQLSFRAMAEFYQVPHVVIDIPKETGEDAVEYVAGQLRSLTRRLEELCGRKLEEAALRETVERSQRTLETYRRYLSLRGGVSMPATMTGEMCSMIADHIMLGRPESEEYMRRLLHAVETAKPRDERKKRIYWMHTYPNWQDSMKGILESGDRCELVGADLGTDSLTRMDPEKPYESMARRVVNSLCNGPSLRRIEAALQGAREARADGVILFCHWGCKQTLGMAQTAKQTLEAAGVPTLVLDGDGCDARNVADGQMVTRVNAFLEQLEGVGA